MTDQDQGQLDHQERQTGPEARARRYREKKAASGVKQVNVQVPDQHIDNIKRIAAHLRGGKTLREACASVLPPPPARQTTDRDIIMREAGRASGWRRIVLRWLLL